MNYQYSPLRGTIKSTYWAYNKETGAFIGRIHGIYSNSANIFWKLMTFRDDGSTKTEDIAMNGLRRWCKDNEIRLVLKEKDIRRKVK